MHAHQIRATAEVDEVMPPMVLRKAEIAYDENAYGLRYPSSA